jgi:hypothetical protein
MEARGVSSWYSRRGEVSNSSRPRAAGLRFWELELRAVNQAFVRFEENAGPKMLNVGQSRRLGWSKELQQHLQNLSKNALCKKDNQSVSCKGAIVTLIACLVSLA